MGYETKKQEDFEMNYVLRADGSDGIGCCAV